MGEIKPSFDVDRQVLGKILPLDTPFNIILDSSEVCNFKCNYCFRSDLDKSHWGYAKNNGLMPWDLFIQCVEQIKEFPQEVRQISLSNHGEPLVNRKIPDMVRYIKRIGLKARISIHTNGSLLDKEYVRDLADSNIDRVVISLQGMNAKKYRDVCGYNLDYNQFYENLSLFHSIKKNTQIHIKIADIALDIGEDKTFYERYLKISDRVYIEQIVPIWKQVNIQSLDRKVKNKYGNEFAKQNCCPLIFHTIVVTPNGDVYPCTQLLSKDILGNVRSSTLRNLWNSEYRKQILMKQLNNKLDMCNECYILQNSIYAEEDMIDKYKEDIIERLGSVNND